MSVISQLDRTYTYIRDQIEGGLIRPGQRLSRRKLAEEVGVSSALVQQALAQLEREGIIVSIPRSGTYVRELTIEEYSHLFDVRELIEPYAAACAASRITPAQIQILRDSCERYAQLQSGIPLTDQSATGWLHRCMVLREEILFHGTILEASGNPLLAKLVSSLRLLCQVGPQLVYADGHSNENNPLLISYEHEGIVEAIAARDPELAREQMLNHIRGGRILIDNQPSGEQKKTTSPVGSQ